VNRPRDQFLAGTAFTHDQHVGRRRTDASHLVEHPLHGRPGPDQPILLVQPPPQFDVGLLQPLAVFQIFQRGPRLMGHDNREIQVVARERLPIRLAVTLNRAQANLPRGNRHAHRGSRRRGPLAGRIGGRRFIDQNRFALFHGQAGQHVFLADHSMMIKAP
jgi:hypothetical protein